MIELIYNGYFPKVESNPVLFRLFVFVVVVWFGLVLFWDTINLRCLRDSYIKISVLSGTLLS